MTLALAAVKETNTSRALTRPAFNLLCNRCEYCKRFMPTWSLLADHYGKIPHSEHVTIAKVGQV